jgi:hypothetical protein
MTALRADPFIGSVRKLLVLPEGHFVLEVVDQFPAGFEGISPVRTRRSDHDRRISHLKFADPVHRGEGTHRVIRHDLLRDRPHRAYCADEQRDPARRLVADGLEDLLQGAVSAVSRSA